MKAFRVLLMVFGVMLCTCTVGQAIDGKGWKALGSGVTVFVREGDEEQMKETFKKVEFACKMSYLKGILDQHNEDMGITQETSKNVYKPLPDTYEELVSAVDRFYSDYRNVKLPVTLALTTIAMEMRGEDAEKIDQSLRFMRKSYADDK